MMDEFDGRPYESIEDWKKEIRHLKWPTIILIILIIMLIIFIDIFLPE